MTEYNFQQIEQQWQKYWEDNNTYKAEIDTAKPKYYVLDMFPYPSGAGLHVGHPLGYIATDIVARYKRLKGYNVLHPMGFDSFGLPAEQYAVQTGQHPAVTTDVNIKRYKEQLEKLGFSFDWSREVRTSDSNYYKWTQWIFLRLFDSWYNKQSDKAESISSLIAIFEEAGNASVNASYDEGITMFTAEEWKKKSEKSKQELLLQYRMTYIAESIVNWCPGLGTVLANEEVKEGVSERGGFPVERKKMRQWMMRINAYADRLLQGLDTIDWPEPMKEMQRNWIGKSYGAELKFEVVRNNPNLSPLFLTVFTTRVDTTFGVTYLSIAPEHELITELTAPDYKADVETYVNESKNRSERDRMSDVKTVSGQFTGTYVINPFNKQHIPLYIADYVLAGYGTGIVMAVPSSDIRDYRFATHFGLPIIPVQEGLHTDITQDDFDPKAGTLINSEFLNGLSVNEAIPKAIKFVEANDLGKGKINFKMRDAIFSRQRYWGEPIPIRYEDGMPYPFKESELPLILPKIDKYQPTETGEPPLGRSYEFVENNFELNTMPGWAGSSWYFLRYMDPRNQNKFVGKVAENYWNQVDLYIGGAEHATGHLLYSRFWNQFLYDLGFVSFAEPFKKLINQGMIQGRSSFVYRIAGTNTFVSANLKKQYDTQAIHIDINLVDQQDILDLEAFKNWRSDFAHADFILEDGKYICGHEVEKMSKSKYNVVNPDDMVEKYGADTLRMYEMFLGPLEQFKPWNTHGIDGVYRFLRKLWRLFYNEQGKLLLDDASPTKEELKILHKTLKKVEEDIERYSFNTCVSTFMICVNELQELKCHKKAILQDLIVALAPFAPHISEALWHQPLNNLTSISLTTFPAWSEAYLVENDFEYPVSINGKMRVKINLPLTLTKEEIEQRILESDTVQKWLEGKPVKKSIIIPHKIVNLVI